MAYPYSSPYRNPYTRSANLRMGQPNVNDYYSGNIEPSPRATYKSTMLLPAGQDVPEGYVVVSQGQDGSAVIRPQDEVSSSPQPQPVPAPTATPSSSPVGSMLVGAAIADPELVTNNLPSASSITDQADKLISGLSGSQSVAPSASSVLPVGTDVATGGTLMSDGTVAPYMTDLAPAAAEEFGGLAAGQIGLGSAAAGVAGAYGMHDLFSHGNTKPVSGTLQGAASGAGLGFMVGGPVGAGIGAAAGGLLGLGKSLFGHKLNASEQVQQNIRTAAGNLGLFERPNGSSHAMVRLADGSYYDVEQGDGHVIDPDMPFGSQLIGWTDPLSVLLNGGVGERDGEGRSAFTGYVVNAAYSNAKNIDDARANILAQYEKLGLSKEQVIEGLTQLKDSGAIDEEFYAALVNSTNTLYDGNPDSYNYQSPRELDPNFGGESPQTQRPIGGAPLPPGTVNIPEGNPSQPEIARIPSSQPAQPQSAEPPRNLIPKIDPIALAKKGYPGLGVRSGRE